MNGSFRELLIWICIWLLPLLAAFVVCQIFMSMPARRAERSRLFLDLLETAIKTGQSPERMIVSVSETKDRSVSVHFHLLAARIEEGMKLELALACPQWLLPPNVAEVVRVGCTQSTLPQLLPAARQMLSDIGSRMRGALNYLIVFMIVILPGVLFFLPFFTVFIWPKFKQVMVDMEVDPPLFTTVIFDNVAFLSLVQAAVLGGMLLLAMVYVAGPNTISWTRKFLGGWPDRLLLWLPWRRNRVHRDFTSVLSVLLDAGLQESRAVELAADATANEIFQRRAHRVCRKLREGIPLPEALKSLESSPEFQWRWHNALRMDKGFFACLRGWHETLEARAFQQEQAAAHFITTGIILVNGVFVAAIIAAVFLILIALIEQGTLW